MNEMMRENGIPIINFTLVIIQKYLHKLHCLYNVENIISAANPVKNVLEMRKVNPRNRLTYKTDTTSLKRLQRGFFADAKQPK